MALEPLKLYIPYNSNYCAEINCPHRKGKKCKVKKCIHPKKIRWWTLMQEK